MTVSAFGVEHDRDIYKSLFSHGSKGAKSARLRALTQQGADALRTATGRAINNPNNKDATVRELPKIVARQAADDSPYGNAIDVGERVVGRVKQAKAEGRSTSVLDNMTVGDLLHGSSVTRTRVQPENLVRGKKTTKTISNPLTGSNEQFVRREGNTFFKPKHTRKLNGGEAEVVNNEAGGLTGKGKIAFVGGPAAAAGLGGIALNEKSKRNAYGY